MLASHTSTSKIPTNSASHSETADATHAAELEERIRKLTLQLESANQVLESFAYSVSHDLRAPLRSIRGFSDALLERNAAQLDGGGKEFLHRVRDASQQMERMIEELLKFSRIGRATLTPAAVNLSALAEDITEGLRHSDPKRAIEFNIAPNLWAEGDPKLLRIILEKFLENSWKFCSQKTGTRIEFGATLQAPAPEALASASHVSDFGPAFFVRDNGAGFDMTNVGRLFTPFQRLHTSAEFEGLGIGLATVQRIIERHGGQVWAEGRPGQGATIFFTLPEPAESGAGSG